MRPVLKCGNATWFEIETEFEAAREGLLGQHGVVHFFKRDRADDRHAATYYSLRQSSVDIGNAPPLVTMALGLGLVPVAVAVNRAVAAGHSRLAARLLG